tara:strand:+ start:798 stop:1058 length:261 start_codon:yes stop_codon:yes gene_type:complete
MDPELEIDDEIENTAAEEDMDIDETEEEENPILDMVNAIGEEDYSSAADIFSSSLNDRLNDAIEQSRVNIASSMYGNEQETVDADI